MTHWLCIHQPANQLYLCQADTSATAVQMCDAAHGIVSPDSNVTQVFLATPSPIGTGRALATDGMGSWFGVDDLSIRVLSRDHSDADDIEEELRTEPSSEQPFQRNLDYDTWENRYLPEVNSLNQSASFNGTLYETYGTDLDYIEHCAPTRIWTLVENEGDHVILPGRHTINRIGYFVTTRPYGLANAPTAVFLDTDPSRHPGSFLRSVGYDHRTIEGEHGFARDVTRDIVIFITGPRQGTIPLSEGDDARVRIFDGHGPRQDIPIDIRITDLKWLPSLVKSAEIQALDRISDPIERLTTEYRLWLQTCDLPAKCAHELIHQDISDQHRAWLTDFIRRWDDAEDENDQARKDDR